MNILVFSTFHLPPHFLGLNLEFIQRNLDDGHRVYLIDCNGSFSECGFNPYKLKYMCEICKFRENDGLKYINGDVRRSSLNNIITLEDRNTANNFLNNFKIIKKDLVYSNFEVGEAVFSPYISKTRDREFVSETDQSILKKLSFNSIITYESVKRFITENNIKKITLFNGRWDLYRAALAAARLNKIEVEIFENYKAGGYHENFGENLPHNIYNKIRLIEEHWSKNSNQEEKLKIAEDFYAKKKNGEALLDKSYTKSQIKGKLPEGYNNSKKTYVLFNSSDDEFAAVGREFDNPFFTDQLEGILYLTDYFSDHPELQLIIRMHPNLKGLIKEYLIPLYAIENKHPNIILIKPEDDTDTYELMAIADTVISFGSTAGLESAYWGKPVILLGKCFYFYADVAYIPNSLTDIPQLLATDLQPIDSLNTKKFAYYFETGGSKSKYYLNEPNGDIYFKDQLLNTLPFWFKIYYKTLKYFNIKN